MLWFVLFVVPVIVSILLFIYIKLEQRHDEKFLSEEKKEALKGGFELPQQSFIFGGAFVVAIVCAILAPSEGSIINIISSSVSYGLIGFLGGVFGTIIFSEISNYLGKHLFCRGLGWHTVYGIFAISAIVIAIKCLI